MFDPQKAVADWIACPSVSTDPAYADGMVAAREFIGCLLTDMGMAVEAIETPKHPIVLAERRTDPSHPTVVVYGHYDVQPPDPLEKWSTPAFKATEKNGRLYGRGAADNKGPCMVHVAAIARLLEKHPDLPLNLTFFIEGEEEIGSPSMPWFFAHHAERLQGDFILLSDTASPSPEQIALTVGLRGIVAAEVELTGPRTDLHSGIHGGAVRNPLQALVQLCASLHDEDGRVNIPGFYDGVVEPQEWEREEVARLGLDSEAYRDFLDVPDFFTTDGLTPFEATRFAPTLEFNGLGGGYQGAGTKTIIPSRAFAKISCRLVAGQDPKSVQELLLDTLRARVAPEVRLELKTEHAGAPYRVVPPGRPDTPADQNPHLAKAFKAAHKGIEKAFGKPPLYLREGGSVPVIADFKEVLGLDSLMMGMFTTADNLHAPDESFHLGMFEKGIEASAAILAAVAGVEA